MIISREFTFDSAHILPNHRGKCRRLHGHTYRMQVAVESHTPLVASDDPSGEGMLLDFTDLDTVVKKAVIDQWDHRFLAKGDEWPVMSAAGSHLNDICGVGVRTTAENLAALAASRIHEGLRFHIGPSIIEFRVVVKLWETPKSFAQVVFP